MFSMPGINWYTDTFDSYRVIATVDGGITKHERQKVLSAVPCRVYNNPNADISMSEQAATQATQNWGQWNLTTYGQQYASIARMYVIGGSYII
jgi:hypothetical protein